MSSRALKLEDNFYINMDNIVTFIFGDDSIQITTNSEAHVVIDITLEGPVTGAVTVVTIQEFHRIKREINDYMGVKSI